MSALKTRYYILNAFFHCCHLAIVSFILFAWIFPQARLFHLVFIFLTLGSWYILGIWMGSGYCPITDWHWKLKARMGEGRPSGTYIHYLVSHFLGIKMSSNRVDRIVVIVTGAVTLISITLNLMAWMTRQ
jgi:hypothetical protein